jgi:hypothetical protein
MQAVSAKSGAVCAVTDEVICVALCAGREATGRPCGEGLERSLFRAKINSDYNDFVARVALEVVDSFWWK